MSTGAIERWARHEQGDAATGAENRAGTDTRWTRTEQPADSEQR
jgi:hypothetical protein